MAELSQKPLQTKVGIAITGNVDAGKCFKKGTKIRWFQRKPFKQQILICFLLL